MQLCFMDNTNEVVFDICFFYTGIKPGYATLIDLRGILFKPIRFIKEVKFMTFDGVKYPVPNHLEEFLTWKYGDWNVPKTNKSEWQDESPNLILWK